MLVRPVLVPPLLVPPLLLPRLLPPHLVAHREHQPQRLGDLLARSAAHRCPRARAGGGAAALAGGAGGAGRTLRAAQAHHE